MVAECIAKINRADFTVMDVKQSSMPCFAHFVDSDFPVSPALMEAICSDTKNLQLKPSAVPLVFPTKEPEKERENLHTWRNKRGRR